MAAHLPTGLRRPAPRALAWTLLAAGALLLGPAAARAQDPAPAPPPVPVQGTQDAAGPRLPAAGAPEDRAQRILRARERWDRMSPEEQQRIRARFEQWRRMTPEQREEMRRRLDRFGGREGVEAARSQVRKATPEQLERMRVTDGEVGRQWMLFQEALPPLVRERWGSAPPEMQEWRRQRFAKAYLALCMEGIVLKYASPEEAAAIHGKEPQARRAALGAVVRRFHEEVLAGSKAELDGLAPAERRLRAVDLVQGRFLAIAREGLAARLQKRMPFFDRREARGAREWFPRDFGIQEEELGVPWAARQLGLALQLRAAQDRAAFLEAARPELKRIAGLPLPERGPALRAFLDRTK